MRLKIPNKILAGVCGLVLLCSSLAVGDNRPWRGDPMPVGEIIVQLDNPRQRDISFDWEGLVKEIVNIKPGDQLTRDKLKTAVSALEAFGHARTQVQVLEQGASITFLLLPYQRIKTIDIKGVYPLFVSDIHKLMTLSPGDIYNPAVIRDQAELIENRYRAEGYINPEAEITWKHDKSDGHIHVDIKIRKGSTYTLDDIEISGNQAFSDTDIKGHMSTWRSWLARLGNGRLVTTRLERDLKNLLAYYRKQGYADAIIKHSVKSRPQEEKIDLQIDIQEGPQYVVGFDGNHHFSDRKLKKELVLFKKGNSGNMGLRRSIRNIRRRYRQSGFADVKVQWREIPSETDSMNQRKVVIQIQEGPRYIVDKVTVSGNRALDTESVKAQMLTEPAQGLNKGAFVSATLKEDIAAVEGLYHQHGYLDVRLSEIVTVHPQTHRVSVTLSIDEGVRSHVDEVRIEGRPPIAIDALLAALPIKQDNVFSPGLVEEGENDLSSRIAPLGYPHVRVQGLADISTDPNRVDIVYTIDPGPYAEVGKIYWAGNFRTRNSLLRREIGLKEGEPFSLESVLAAQRRLRDLDLFQSLQVRSIGLKEKASKVHLLVTMVENPAYFFELGGGFRTDKAFYGRTLAGDRNFLGLNKEIRVGGEVSGIGYRWDLDIIEPQFLGSSISADLGLFTERREEFNQDFGTDTTGGSLTFSRPWSPRLTTALGLRYERREQFLRENDTATTSVDPATLEPRTIWVTTPAIRYDSRDSFIRPRKGYLASFSADISKGLDDTLDDFIKYKVDLRTYYSPIANLTLAGRALAGYLQPYGDNEEIPEDQLFFLGGTTDVRGFGENLLRFNAERDPVGGRLAMAGSIEARFALTSAWELTLFVDAGSVQDATSDNGEGDDRWRYATGLGLRYITPIGPIGLLYGHKLDPQPNESAGQFHFSMGYTF